MKYTFVQKVGQINIDRKLIKPYFGQEHSHNRILDKH